MDGQAFDPTLTRRRLLRRGVAAGGALALVPLLARPAGATTAKKRRRLGPAQRFFRNEGVNFEALFGFGGAGYGAGEFGELVTVVNRINERGATYDAVYDEFVAMGARLRSSAEQALAKGHPVTARSAFLRAAQYFDQALFFVLGTGGPGREADTYRQMNDCFTRAAGLSTPAFEPVAIPYEGGTMPGWLLKPAGSTVPRPTVIVNNGSDGQLIDVYGFGGAAAVERGYNALLFEGPGQGSMLFERGIPFRPDWEKVVTPIVDFLAVRPDVDPARIAITGWSMCGELVPRAAAFEHRLAAVVADPGVVNVAGAWPLDGLEKLVRAGKRQQVDRIWQGVIASADAEQRFTLAKRSEIFKASGGFELIRDLLEYTNRDVAHLITAPTLVTAYELEAFYPGQAKELYDLLTTEARKLATFTVAEGAQYHDAPMAPHVRNGVVYDWLDETLGL